MTSKRPGRGLAVAFAAWFLFASFTPSLVPRSWYVQRGADTLPFAETPSLLPYLTLALDMRVARTRRYESER